MNVRFPGKLFLMGEYAIMESGQYAVVAAVNRFLTVHIEPAPSIRIESAYGVLYEDKLLQKDNQMEYVSCAVLLAHEVLQHKVMPYRITIDSQLEDHDIKFGFGSSGVVIVALIDAILKFHGKAVGRRELFKLSVIAQARMGKLSSGGDLASSIYGGVIRYTRYDVDWLNQQQLTPSLARLDWPLLNITPLNAHAYKLNVGWTQKANKTDDYLSRYDEAAQQDPMTYRAFMMLANKIVDTFISAWQEEDDISLAKAMRDYRKWMLQLQAWTHLDIETEKLATLIEIANRYTLPAKISGSGGGDCGFALSSAINHENSVKCHKEWVKNDILYMDIEVFEHE